jgi:hypothetical protein
MGKHTLSTTKLTIRLLHGFGIGDETLLDSSDKYGNVDPTILEEKVKLSL